MKVNMPKGLSRGTAGESRLEKLDFYVARKDANGENGQSRQRLPDTETLQFQPARMWQERYAAAR
jgi:hypothetical protein